MYTIEFIQKRISLWLKAEEAAAANKSYTIDGVSYTRQDIDQIMRQLAYWQKRLARAKGTGGRGHVIRPSIQIDNDSWGIP